MKFFIKVFLLVLIIIVISTLKIDELKSIIYRLSVTYNIDFNLILAALALAGGSGIIFALIRALKSLKRADKGIIDDDLFHDDDELQVDRESIAEFFLTIYRAQLGKGREVPAKIIPLDSHATVPNVTYELRIAHNEDWESRRMTVGPAGEESSRSKCFHVIYNDHLVVKIPPSPIKDFRSYIESIISYQRIVKKLSPRECIVPGVSVILKMLYPFPDESSLSSTKIEDKYIRWLHKWPSFHEYLKIGPTFVFVMDLSKYFFLSNIIKDVHDIKKRLYKEIVGNPDVIFDSHGFEGRYGFENDVFCDKIRDVYLKYEKALKRLVKNSRISSPIPIITIQRWFLIHIAQRGVEKKEKNLPPEFIDALNRLIKKTLGENQEAIRAYRDTIKRCIQKVTVKQNKTQMGGIITNIIDLLAWLREKRIAMRDLKPENLLVAGDLAKYPAFLNSPSSYTIGLIDVETAIDYETSKGKSVPQPMLGGTPSYATPSHLFLNDLLSNVYPDLSRILYLQDWYSTIEIIYEIILGQRLFEETGKLMLVIKNIMLKPDKEENHEYEIYKKASQMYWHSAKTEFTSKTNSKGEMLKSVNVTIPKNAAEMFKNDLLKEKQYITQKIKDFVKAQAVFLDDKTCQGLISASYKDISRLKTRWENGKNIPGEHRKEKTKLIGLLHELGRLKSRAEKQALAFSRLNRPKPVMSAYELMELLFGIVFNSMYLEKWGDLSGVYILNSGTLSNESLFEATV